MKQAAFALMLLLAAACASSKAQHGKPAKPDVAIDVAQIVGPAQLNYPYGPMEVQYEFLIQNPSAEPITLIRIEVGTLNMAGGPYTLRRDFYRFNKTIPANGADTVKLWARAFGYGRTMRANEPITLRAIAYFQSPNGTFQKIFIRELSQYPD
jgi:hypothetical protein